DDLFPRSIPMNGAALAEALHAHAAGDGDFEAEIERAVRFLAGADAIEKILHVGERRGDGAAKLLGGLREIDFLRDVADLRALHDRAVVAEHVFGDAELVVAEARVPTDEDLFGLLERDVHRVRNFAAV